MWILTVNPSSMIGLAGGGALCHTFGTRPDLVRLVNSSVSCSCTLHATKQECQMSARPRPPRQVPAQCSVCLQDICSISFMARLLALMLWGCSSCLGAGLTGHRRFVPNGMIRPYDRDCTPSQAAALTLQTAAPSLPLQVAMNFTAAAWRTLSAHQLEAISFNSRAAPLSKKTRGRQLLCLTVCRWETSVKLMLPGLGAFKEMATSWLSSMLMPQLRKGFATIKQLSCDQRELCFLLVWYAPVS